jgi:hypothetical protein
MEVGKFGGHYYERGINPMSKPARSAELIMKLYELRREETMREARRWFVAFFPESVNDIMAAMVDPKTSGFYRMVITYWDMAASFVLHDAIDEEMFFDSNGECIVMFSKVQPYLEELRTNMANPKYLKSLEKLIMKQDDALELLSTRRELMKRWMTARAEMAQSAFRK